MFAQCLKNSRQRRCLQYYHIDLEEKSQINYPFHATVWIINVQLRDPSAWFNDFEIHSKGVRKCSELKRICWDLVNHVENHFSILSIMARQRSLHDTNLKCYSKLKITCGMEKYDFLILVVVLSFLHHFKFIPFLLNLPVILFWRTWFWF